MKEALNNQPKTNDEILQNLALGKLPTLEEVSQLSAAISDPEEYKDFVSKLRFAHEIELTKGAAQDDSFGYLLERDGWPNNREKLEKVLGLRLSK